MNPLKVKTMQKTIYWHDYETFGKNPRRDRAAQFAGIRTDEDLNIIDEPLLLYCQPAPDMLPDPAACRITGITPQLALEQGLCEAEFIARIHQEFAQPGTCVAGYNSIRFDDELTRQLLYRNFHDPYEREWKHGNSRWDIIDMLRLCAATRPEGIVWPRKENGSVSFRLEELTAANGLEHAQAHDALSDVMATIAMARLVKTHQPRLYEHIFRLRHKQNVQAEIDLFKHKPLLHVSMMYPASRGCMALVMPLVRHPVDGNGVIVYDLACDPSSWIESSMTEIRERIFTPADQLAPGLERIPLKVLHLNRCPVVVPAAVLSPELAAAKGIALTACQAHHEALLADRQGLEEVAERVAQAFDPRYTELDDVEEREGLPLETDPDYMIYSGGFFNGHDRQLMQQIRDSKPGALATFAPIFSDARLPEMLFRYRARNWPETLSVQEQQRWMQFCADRLAREPGEELHAGLGLSAFRQALSVLRAETGEAAETHLLDELQNYADALAKHLQLDSGVQGG